MALAQALDTMVIDFVSQLLQTPLRTPAIERLLAAPISEGTLNVVSQVTESALHFLSGALALQAIGQICPDQPQLPAAQIQLALDRIAPNMPEPPEVVLNKGELKAAGRRLRNAVYSYIGIQLRTDSPWLLPPAWEVPDDLSKPQATQLRWALSWWTATPATYLPQEPLKLAFRRHIGAAVFEPDQNCYYAPLRTGCLCNTPLGIFNSCAQGPRLHRHHAVVRVWQNLLQSAGYHVQIEQELLLHDNTTHRADLIARNDLGEHIAFDVLVTGSPNLARPIDEHLHRQATQKANRYESHPSAPLPGGVRFTPLAHCSGIPFMHGRTLRLFVKAVNRVARASAPPDETAWGSRLAITSHEHAARLTQTLALADWRMHSCCGRLA